MRAAIIAAGALALLGAAAPARQHGDDLAKALAGRVAGQPVNCIDTQRADGPQIIDDHTILYRESGRRLWRNDLPNACPSLRPMTTIVMRVYGGQTCRNDTFRTIDAGSSIPSPLCRLGSFTPYDLPPKARK
jgi:hypothetical protein